MYVKVKSYEDVNVIAAVLHKNNVLIKYVYQVHNIMAAQHFQK